jgi:peptidoglycan/xylan/chitin deacetylase (PgdA/CDA1 family)
MHAAGVSILMYHQVGAFAPMRTHRAVYCHHRRFAAQMAWLHRLRYPVLRLDEAIAGLRGERPLPARAVVLTFDDGYENFYEYALPVLARYGFPAMVYVLADRLGQPAAWLGVDGRATPPLMSAARLRELRRSNIDIGSHGLTHLRLGQIARPHAKSEIATSKDRLEQVLGERVDHFCYPYGSYDGAVVDMVSAAGYRSAVTCDRASAFAGADPLRLPRKAISFGDSLAGYAWKLHMKSRRRAAPDQAAELRF